MRFWTGLYRARQHIFLLWLFVQRRLFLQSDFDFFFEVYGHNWGDKSLGKRPSGWIRFCNCGRHISPSRAQTAMHKLKTCERICSGQKQIHIIIFLFFFSKSRVLGSKEVGNDPLSPLKSVGLCIWKFVQEPINLMSFLTLDWAEIGRIHVRLSYAAIISNHSLQS